MCCCLPSLQKCCFCADLSTGAHILAGIRCFLWISMILITAFAAGFLDGEDADGSSQNEALVNSKLYFLAFSILAFVFLLGLLSELLLILGAVYKKPCLLYTWLTWALCTLLALVVTFVSFFSTTDTRAESGFWGVIVLLQTYCMWVVFSLARQGRTTEGVVYGEVGGTVPGTAGVGSEGAAGTTQAAQREQSAGMAWPEQRPPPSAAGGAGVNSSWQQPHSQLQSQPPPPYTPEPPPPYNPDFK